MDLCGGSTGNNNTRVAAIHKRRLGSHHFRYCSPSTTEAKEATQQVADRLSEFNYNGYTQLVDVSTYIT